LNDKGNRKMLDIFSKNVYAHALNMTQAAQQLAALNNDNAALLDGAKAVADSLAGTRKKLFFNPFFSC
jgi:hypothetical protein